MSSISTTSASAKLGLTDPTVTVKQDAVRQQIATASAQVKSDSAGVAQAQTAATQVQEWFDKLPAKEQAKSENIAKRNLALDNVQQLRAKLQDSQKKLADITATLPAAIQADRLATENNRNREKTNEDNAETQERQATAAREEGKEIAKDDERQEKQQAQGKSDSRGARSAADVVGSAATGTMTESRTEHAPAPAPKTVVDGEGQEAAAPTSDAFTPQAPQKGAAKYASNQQGGSNAMPLEEGDEPSAARGGERAAKQSPAGTQVQAQSQGKEPAPRAAAENKQAAPVAQPSAPTQAAAPAGQEAPKAFSSAPQAAPQSKLATAPQAQQGQAAAPQSTVRTNVATGSSKTTASGQTQSTGGGVPMSIGEASSYAGSDDIVTDSGKRFSDLPQSMQDHITMLTKEAKELASKGKLKELEDCLMKGWQDIGKESGTAEPDDAAGGKQSDKKKSQNKAVGAAGKSANSNSLTAAGNAQASTTTGATGATNSAPEEQVAGFVGASGDEGGGGQAANSGAANTIGGSAAQGGSKAASPAGSNTVGGSGSSLGGATASEMGVTPGTELGKAYFGGMSPMELVQMVMLKAFQEAGEDVKNAAEMMQRQTEAKQQARATQNSLRPLISYDDKGKLSDVAVDGNMSAKSAQDTLTSIDGNIDAIGDDNQILMIRLQSLTQLMTTMSQATSNMSKSAYDTTKSVVGQIGH